MANVDGHRVELLRTDLSVFETEAIECQLIFQNKSHPQDVKASIFIF
jgi:hypothetical protein